MTCKYEGCEKQVGLPLKSKYCIFHAPTEEKGVDKNDFNKIIESQINNGDYNFRGYIFPNNIEFRRKEKNQKRGYIFNAPVDFTHATFEGDVDFSEVQFKGNENVDGNKGDLNPLLSCVRFIDTTFKKRAIFHGTIFYKYSDFSDAKFLSKADFGGAQFHNKAIFHDTLFGGKTHFVGNQIYKGLNFTDIIFGERATFYLGAPTGKQKHSGKRDFATINFEHVQFKAFDTFFDKIPIPFKSFEVIKGLLNEIFLIFRYCKLKDVYFTNNDMSLFSFYKSSFDQARFISSTWRPKDDRILFFPFKRKNVIPEEKFLTDSPDKKEFKIEDLNSYEDISSLYRQMKTALDNTKDYQQASWFYFNEFEMKRKALKENIKIEKERLKKLFMRGRLLLYNIYKTFAGYGEKPLWSFWSFVIFSAIFTIWNFISGLKVDVNDITTNVNYNLSLTVGGFSTLITKQFWYDMGNSLMFTLYRVIPVGYLPFHRSKFEPIGLDGLALSFINSVVLILLVVFMAIGLKRHFRRF